MSHNKVVAGIKHKAVQVNFTHAAQLHSINVAKIQLNEPTQEVIRKLTVDNQEELCNVTVSILKELWDYLGIPYDSSVMRMTNKEYLGVMLAQQGNANLSMAEIPTDIELTDEMIESVFPLIPKEILSIATAAEGGGMKCV